MKRISKIIAYLVAVVFSFTVFSSTVMADKPDDKGKDFPVIKRERFQLPVNPIRKVLGADLSVDDENGEITIIKGENIIVINYKNNEITVNGVLQENYLKSRNKNNSRIVPFRFIPGFWRRDIKDKEDDFEEAVVLNNDSTGTGNYGLQYYGEWSYLADDDAYKGDLYISDQINSLVSLKFTGNSIRLFGAKDKDYGIASVSIDGKEKTYIDLYASERENMALIYENTELQYGEHTMVFEVTATRNSLSTGVSVNIDKVEIFREKRTETSLQGTISDMSGTVDLSLEGKKDWVHWGYDSVLSVNRKFSKTKYISEYEKIGDGDFIFYSGNPVKFSWDRGTPTYSVSETSGTAFLKKDGSGFEFTVPVDEETQVLRVYLGAWNATGNFEASIDDSDVNKYETEIISEEGIVNKVVTLEFKGNKEQVLNVKYTLKDSDNVVGSVSLQGATLK